MTQRHEMSLKPVVYRLPGMDDVPVREGILYRDGLGFDLYGAGGPGAAARPVVVIVSGYSDATFFEPRFGCKLKDMAMASSWARLMAASGMAAVTYANREPVGDLDALLAHLAAHAGELGIDATRLGVWSCSGNVPTAVGTLFARDDGRVAPRCGVLAYGYVFGEAVAQVAKFIGFANPTAGRSAADLPRELPIFVARAGRDATPGLNASLDAFVAEALAQNLPLTLANHATGPHSFDLLDDSEASREVIGQILAFLRFHLGAA